MPNCTAVAASELTTLSGGEVHTRAFECPGTGVLRDALMRAPSARVPCRE